MVGCAHKVWIECTPADVFTVLMDPAANSRWQRGVVAAHTTSPGLATVGSRMTEVRELAGCRTTITFELIELDWPRRAVVRLVDGPLTGTASYHCRPVAAGTELTAVCDVTVRWPLPCAGRLLARAGRTELARSLRQLKALLEQQAVHAVPAA
jgi:hypothetical protein